MTNLFKRNAVRTISAVMIAACFFSAAACGTKKTGNKEKSQKEGQTETAVNEDGSVEVPETEPVEGKIEFISSQYAYEDEPNYFEGHGPDAEKKKKTESTKNTETGSASDASDEAGNEQKPEDDKESADGNAADTSGENSENDEGGGLNITGE